MDNNNVIFDLTNTNTNTLKNQDESHVNGETANNKLQENLTVVGPSSKPTESECEPAAKCESIESRLAELQCILANLKITVASAIQEVKQIDKAYTKEKKKKQEREKEVQANASGVTDNNRKSKRPSGFARPVSVTDELCEFMQIVKGTKVARTEVTIFLNKYITDNNLQNKQSKTKINPDGPLKKLLRLNQEELTYFNLQKHMNQHFI